MKYITSFLMLLMVLPPLSAQERVMDENEARSIFEEVINRRKTISTELSTLQMTITDSRDRTRNRTMKMWSTSDDDESKSLIVFSSPGNVRGTAFLTLRENGNSYQRLYLPSVGRIQTITSSERSNRFMGSDFTYEDLGDQQVEDYEFQWFEELESIYRIRAQKPGSDQYEFVEFEIDNERYTLNTIHYFNDEAEQIKRLEAEDYERLTDQLWSPAKMTMFDLREDRKTEITWSDREVNITIPDWRFTERGLRRGI